MIFTGTIFEGAANIRTGANAPAVLGQSSYFFGKNVNGLPANL